MKRRHKANMLPLLLLFSHAAHAVQQTTGIDAQAKLPYWQVSDNAMSLRLVQRLPVQSRAFFMARGFSQRQVERIAQSCIFQTVFKNISHLSNPSVLEYDLRDWRVISQDKRVKMKLREDWDYELRKSGVGTSQRLAFEWSMYPTQQKYKPGDYNWGMSDFNLKPGTHFDLQLKWHQSGKDHQTTIKNMQCAPDINPQSGDEI